MFDELKIGMILKKKLTKDKYLGLPENIRNDQRVIKHFLSFDKRNINFISRDKIADIVNKDFEFFDYLDDEVLNYIFDELDVLKINITYELVVKLNINNRGILFKKKSDDYLACLPNDELSKIIVRSILSKWEDDYREIILPKGMLDSCLSNANPELLLDLLSESLVSEYIIKIIQEKSIEEQIDLCRKDKRFLDYVKRDAKVKFEYLDSNDDLERILSKSIDAKVMFFKEHDELLNCCDISTIVDIILNTDIKIPIERLAMISPFSYSFFCKQFEEKYSVEEIFNLCRYSELFSILFGNYSVNALRSFAMFYPEKKKELIGFIDGLVDKRVIFTDYEKSDSLLLIRKLLLSKKMVMNNDIKLLEEYSKYYDREILINILANAYGEHVREIFNSRPNLNINSFYSFDILDRSILDNFGMNFINLLLSFNYEKFIPIICVIANNDEEMKKFKKYYDFYLKLKKELDITDLTRILSTYTKMYYLIDSLDLDNLSLIERSNLELLITDDGVLVAKINRDNLKDYLEIRRDYYSRKMDDDSLLKDNLFEYLTGRHVNDDEKTIDSINLEKTIEVFNIHNILKDENLIKNIGLTEDEVALLLLLNKINSISNKEVLRDIYSAVLDCKYISPILFRDTFDKIIRYYTTTLKDALISSEKLDSMVSEVVDGIEIINFGGQPYNMLCSVTGLYLSDDMKKLHPNKLLGEDLLEDWLYKSIGRSTISCSLACDGISIYPRYLEGSLTFVFDSNLPIIGMGGSDLSVSHANGDNNHRFNFYDNNKIRFASLNEIKHDIDETKDELRRTGGNKFTSEVVIPRYDEDLRRDVLKRTMPIGIYVEGDITPDVMKTAKVFNDYYQEHGLGKFRIIQVNTKRYGFNYYPDDYADKEDIELSTEWLEEVTEPIRRSGR